MLRAVLTSFGLPPALLPALPHPLKKSSLGFYKNSTSAANIPVPYKIFILNFVLSLTNGTTYQETVEKTPWEKGWDKRRKNLISILLENEVDKFYS